MSETGMGRVCEQCGRAFNAGKSWSKFCSSTCKVRAFRARNRSESDLERLLSGALDAVRRGYTDGPALAALWGVRPVTPADVFAALEQSRITPADVFAALERARKLADAAVADLPPEEVAAFLNSARRVVVAEQPAPTPAAVAEQPAKVKATKPAKVKATPVVAEPSAEQPAPTKQPALFGEELAAVAEKAGDLSEQIAERLRRARAGKVKFAELAREVDLADHSQLSRLAGGKGSVSAKRLSALDAALSRRGF